jgi:hypothetical protein
MGKRRKSWPSSSISEKADALIRLAALVRTIIHLQRDLADRDRAQRKPDGFPAVNGRDQGPRRVLSMARVGADLNVAEQNSFVPSLGDLGHVSGSAGRPLLKISPSGFRIQISPNIPTINLVADPYSQVRIHIGIGRSIERFNGHALARLKLNHNGPFFDAVLIRNCCTR